MNKKTVKLLEEELKKRGYKDSDLEEMKIRGYLVILESDYYTIKEQEELCK